MPSLPVFSKAKYLISLAIYASMLGCGGGGGGGSGSSESSISLENVRYTAIDQEVFEGADPLAPTTVTVDAKGDLQRLNGSTLYVVVQDPDALFGSARVSVNANGLNNQLVLEGRPSNSKVGTFSGAVTVNVCLDAQCATTLKGSPFQVPYRVKVLPGLRFNRSTIALQAAFGSEPAPVSVDVVLPAGATDFDVRMGAIVGKRGWLDTVMRTDKRTNSFVVSAGLAPVAAYDTIAFVSAQGTTSKGRRVYLEASPKVTYSVSATPNHTLISEPAQIVLSNDNSYIGDVQWVNVIAAEDTVYTAAPRIEYLPADGKGVLSAGSVTWLQANPSGNVPFGTVRQEVKFETKQGCGRTSRCLPPGKYQARVYLRTPAGDENPEPLLVTYMGV